MIFPRWELRHTADPLDTRAYGGDGGDGGAGQMRTDEQARQRKVQAAVDAINAKFGIAPSGNGLDTFDVPATGSMFGAPGARNPNKAPSRDDFIIPIKPGGYSEVGDGYMVPTSGSDGGFDQAGYDAATASYNERRAAAQSQVGDVSGAKAAREAMYGDIAGAVRDTAMRDLDRQYGQASKRNTFGLARSGLMGGSADAESGGELQELYGEGKLKATEAGMGAASDLRANDEKTRQNLIGLAQSGLDTGTAASMAAGQMASAADVARSQVAGTNVGRLFDDLSQAYVVNQVGKARYPGAQPGQQPAGYSTNVFSPNGYFGRRAA